MLPNTCEGDKAEVYSIANNCYIRYFRNLIFPVSLFLYFSFFSPFFLHHHLFLSFFLFMPFHGVRNVFLFLHAAYWFCIVSLLTSLIHSLSCLPKNIKIMFTGKFFTISNMLIIFVFKRTRRTIQIFSLL